MKKRAVLIAGIAAALLLLIVPVPTGVYKDGGTREYTALTYRVVRWKRLASSEQGVYKKTRVYPLPLNFRSIDSLWEREVQRAGLQTVQTIDPMTEAAKPEGHTHAPATEEQWIENRVLFWCGNTITHLKFGEGNGITAFYGGESVGMTSIFANLAYDPAQVCDCPGDYTAYCETQEDEYRFSLTGAWVRCSAGQAALTTEQVERLQQIVEAVRAGKVPYLCGIEKNNSIDGEE